VVVNLTYKKILRVAPAINIPEEELDRGIDGLVRVIGE
jgi:acetylornithine/succinyldiaminopimelate/putrescine aminotransferase